MSSIYSMKFTHHSAASKNTVLKVIPLGVLSHKEFSVLVMREWLETINLYMLLGDLARAQFDEIESNETFVA